MKQILLIVLLLAAAGASAQDKSVVITARGSYLLPVGALGDRFRGGYGGSIDIAPVQDSPVWSGSFEYVKFSRGNEDKFVITRPIRRDSLTQQRDTVQGKIVGLRTSLEVFGAAANITYDVWLTSWSTLKLGAGFGFYFWKGTRGAFADTIRGTAAWGPVVVATPNVPELKQEDWSGGFNAGFDLSVFIAPPLSLQLGARYKLIVGELWPTLALDLENVSTFQMLDLRAGISIGL